MKIKTLVYLTAVLIALGAPALALADDSTSATNSAPSAPAQGSKRGQAMRELLPAIGLTRTDMQGLSQEERRAKVKDAMEKKVAELKAKKDAGTLTDQDKKDFMIIEKFKNRANQGGAKPQNKPDSTK